MGWGVAQISWLLPKLVCCINFVCSSYWGYRGVCLNGVCYPHDVQRFEWDSTWWILPRHVSELLPGALGWYPCAALFDWRGEVASVLLGVDYLSVLLPEFFAARVARGRCARVVAIGRVR